MDRITRHCSGTGLPRHRHVKGYAAVVLSGGYIEAGDHGRVRVTTGDAVLHGPYQSHKNDFGAGGAVVLNLPLPSTQIAGIRRTADVDAIARLAERDPIEAAALLLTSKTATPTSPDDWPDRLALALSTQPDICLGAWAANIGIAPQSLSRGFRQVYGVSPKRFRADQRTLHAVTALRQGPAHLAQLAVELGFADQAHLTRAVVAFTGQSPKRLRVQSVQDGSHDFRD